MLTSLFASCSYPAKGPPALVCEFIIPDAPTKSSETVVKKFVDDILAGLTTNSACPDVPVTKGISIDD